MFLVIMLKRKRVVKKKIINHKHLAVLHKVVVALVANTTLMAHQPHQPHQLKRNQNTPLMAHQTHQPRQLKKMKQVAVAIHTPLMAHQLHQPHQLKKPHQQQVVALVAINTPLQAAHQLHQPHQPQRHQLVVGTL